MSTTNNNPSSKSKHVPNTNANDRKVSSKSHGSNQRVGPTTNEESVHPKHDDSTPVIGSRSPTESQTDRWTNEGGTPQEESVPAGETKKQDPSVDQHPKPVRTGIKPATTTVANSSVGGTTDASGRAPASTSDQENGCNTTESGGERKPARKVVGKGSKRGPTKP